VLEVEGGQTLEAKAALEDAHREMDRLRQEMGVQLKALQVCGSAMLAASVGVAQQLG
jgi:hypothetical protein